MITMQETVSSSDLSAVSSDFTPGDGVFIAAEIFPVLANPMFAIVSESTDDKLVINNATTSLTFDAKSTPSLEEVLKNISRNMDLGLLEVGTILSRVSFDPNGKAFRQYAEVRELTFQSKEIRSRNVNSRKRLEGITLYIMNGPKSGKTLKLGGDLYKSFKYRMSLWQIEE